MSMFSIRHISPRGERRELYVLARSSLSALDYAHDRYGIGSIIVKPARRKS